MAAERKTTKSQRRMAARLAAVQALYDIDMTEHGPRDVISGFTKRGGTAELEGEDVPADAQLFADIVRGVSAEHADLDRMIAGAGTARPDVARYETLMRAILRAGAYELWRHAQYDAPLLISQYLAVTESFYDRTEIRLVNAVLDALAKTLRAGGDGHGGGGDGGDPLADPIGDPAAG